MRGAGPSGAAQRGAGQRWRAGSSAGSGPAARRGWRCRRRSGWAAPVPSSSVRAGRLAPRLAPRHRWLPPSGAGGKGRLGWGARGTRLPGGSQVFCPLKVARGGCAAGSGTAAAPGSRASPCPRVWGKTLFPFKGLIIQARRVPWQRRIAWKPWENAAFGLNLFLLCVELVLFLFR